MEKQKLFSISCGIAGAMVACSCAQQPEAEWKQSPNVIYILADDLGIGDISPYGQSLIKTPNLQRMSDEGMRFTQCYSGTSVSAPSRASLMTGQHTGHTYIRGNMRMDPEVHILLQNCSMRLVMQPGVLENGVWDIQVPNQIRLKWASMSSWGIIVKHWLMIIIPIICGTVQNV